MTSMELHEAIAQLCAMIRARGLDTLGYEIEGETISIRICTKKNKTPCGILSFRRSILSQNNVFDVLKRLSAAACGEAAKDPGAKNG